MTALYRALAPGEPAPWFAQRTGANPRFVFDTAAGRHIVLCFFASAANDHARAALDAMRAMTGLFDDTRASFFGVSHDAHDETEARIADHLPGFRYFWDFDGTIGRLYGALPKDAEGAAVSARQLWVILDPALRILMVQPFLPDRSDIAKVTDFVRALPIARPVMEAPVLILPDVFEPELCAALIQAYETGAQHESGFMRERDGRTVLMHDPAHKRRRDHSLADAALIKTVQARVLRRITPMIERAYQFRATRMERYIVACYDAIERAHFRAHRDNTTKATAHRRFAVSLLLNDAYEGGELSFPEYGPRSYKPPAGAALVFSCSLLHAVSAVTEGRRYAFLPFLYDDEAAKIRERNIGFLEDGTSVYESGLE